MRTFIIGAKGQLGTEFVKIFSANGWDYAAADIDTLDISDADAVMRTIMGYKPGLIINCAAYNQVDKAETDSSAAFAVNAEGARTLAMAARKLESKLLHFSTDYVFDGAKKVPYTETDATNPINKYGSSKLKGEEYVLEAPGSLIFRLSWVYGTGPQNFITKLSQWAKAPGPLKVTTDEISVPTSARDVAEVSMAALKNGLTGTWHLVNSGFCSRYEWAQLILKEYGINKELAHARMADFCLPAKRPGYSAMSSQALARELGVNIPEWRESVSKFIMGER